MAWPAGSACSRCRTNFCRRARRLRSSWRTASTPPVSRGRSTRRSEAVFRRRARGPLQLLAAGEAFADPVPVLDPLLAQLPAQLDELVVAIGGKVDQALERSFELDAHAVEVQHGFQQLLFGALNFVPSLLLAFPCLAVGPGTLGRVFGHAQLLLEVWPEG